MISYDAITNNDKFPKFIRKGLKQQAVHTPIIDKIFPYIGLNNFEYSLQEVKIDLCSMYQNTKFVSKCADISETRGTDFVSNFFNYLKSSFHLRRLKREYSSEGTNSIKIVFSSTGTDGAWDIATMSMRGLKSCQAWDSSRKYHLIGSITDPCCAIIYMCNTDLKGAYGSEMMFRAVVRYTVHSILGPCLFMENIYPHVSSFEEKRYLDYNAIRSLFASLLYKHSKLPVLYNKLCNRDILKLVFIPKALSIQHLSLCDYNYLSYRDSELEYQFLTKYDLKSFPQLQYFHNRFVIHNTLF